MIFIAERFLCAADFALVVALTKGFRSISPTRKAPNNINNDVKWRDPGSRFDSKQPGMFFFTCAAFGSTDCVSHITVGVKLHPVVASLNKIEASLRHRTKFFRLDDIITTTITKSTISIIISDKKRPSRTQQHKATIPCQYETSRQTRCPRRRPNGIHSTGLAYKP